MRISNKDVFISKKRKLLYLKGLTDGSIVPFDDEFYNILKNKFIHGIPVYFYAKYGITHDNFSNAFILFLCSPDTTLVSGSLKGIRSKKTFEWVESDNYVYDLTLKEIFEKDLYYEIFNPANTVTVTKKDIESDEKAYLTYQDVQEATIDYLKPDGMFQLDLLTAIPVLHADSKASGNQEFLDDVAHYEQVVQYDEKALNTHLNEIAEEMARKYNIRL